MSFEESKILFTQNLSNSFEFSSSKIYFATTLSLNRINWGKEPFRQGNICISCTDENSNRCQRIVKKLLTDPNNRNLTQCGEGRNGEWSDWEETEDCEMIEEVIQGNKCGRGFNHRNRTCMGRTYGGRHCQVLGKDVPEGVGYDTFMCIGTACPGKVKLF